MEAVRACYRLLVMVGTLVVLGLAYIAYGPPVEELGPLCQRAGDVVAEAIAEWSSETPPTESDRLALTPVEPLGNTSSDSEQLGSELTTIAPATSGPSQASSIANSWPSDRGQINQATAMSATNPSTLVDPMKPMIDELNSLGMGSHKLHRWGHEGELYRFSCRVSVPGDALIQQHFEAVASEPAAAVAGVLSQVRSAR